MAGRGFIVANNIKEMEFAERAGQSAQSGSRRKAAPQGYKTARLELRIWKEKPKNRKEKLAAVLHPAGERVPRPLSKESSALYGFPPLC